MAYMYIKPVQKSEADKIDGFFFFYSNANW